MNGGIYIAVFHLPRPRRVRVGKLGSHRFAAGWYLYVGTAQRNLDARLSRHARRDKRLHWHIDYLSAEARMIGAILVPGPKPRECELARELADLYPRPMPGFGASDCRCGGHLFLCGIPIPSG